MLESLTTNQSLNSAFQRELQPGSATGDAASNESRLNAFGIGRANQAEVELSPQARILQQTEQAQNERREAIQQNSEQQQDTQEEQPDETTDNFVRVNSSVGSAQRNSLTSEQATELYRSIEKLI